MEIFNKKLNGNFEQVRFVALAVSKEQVRYSYMHVQVTEDHMQATDGYRAHRHMSNAGLEPGLYKVMKITKTEVWLDKINEDLAFPDIDKVIPEPLDLQEFSSADCNARLAQVLRTHPESDRYFNHLYFDQAQELAESFQWSEDKQPCRFNGKDIVAVLMPAWN